MDSNLKENADSKEGFRKPLNDAANRKYRRRSPVCGSSSSSDGSPQHERRSYPVPSRDDNAKAAGDRQKKDESRELNRDRQSSRSYHRHDDHGRRDKRVDDYDRGYSKPSYRSGRDLRDLDYSRRDKEFRSRDYQGDVDKYSREKSDGSGNRRKNKDSSDRAGSGRRHDDIEDTNKDILRHREDRGGQDGKKDHRSFGERSKEASRRDAKEVDAKRYTMEEKRSYDDRDKNKEQHNLDPEKISDDVNAFSRKDQDSVAKKSKISSFDNTVPGTNGASEKACVTDSDIDAAKVAAMKAAELVNKNLIGTGYMSTDQKKKLLWGNKKNTTTEESTHRWDAATFGDRERQEKFNKLMVFSTSGVLYC
ncbi:hypothetical protein ACJIZ3_005599 [Penstemon smallii]|uniref:Arginine/serine-rich coiled-coil protein 2 n=1 Tax=Penstemon smallii TaxID=265156 RepID=A0ABD3S5B4_9LAMI